MAVVVPRHARLLDRDAAVVVVVDVQESYRAVLHEYERVARAVSVLVQGAGGGVATALIMLVIRHLPRLLFNKVDI